MKRKMVLYLLKLIFSTLIIIHISIPYIDAQFAHKYGNFYDIQGDYCRTRSGSYRCCNGRLDSCSVPILGTLCYCDQFCNRTVQPDCCPDYWETCLGISPGGPEALLKENDCFLDDVRIPHLDSVMNNCNKCKCKLGTLTCENDQCMVDEEYLRRLQEKSGSMGWTVSNYSFLWGKKLDEGLLYKTGTLEPDRKSMKMHPIRLHYDYEQLPKSFDARRKWSGLGGIRDQGWCGSSWAFSTISIAQDRLAIASNGAEIVDLSTQNLVSCNRRGQLGCNGGHIERAWSFLRKFGVVTEDCYPYVSGSDGVLEQCKIPKHSTLQSIKCQRKEFPVKRKRLYTTEPSYRIASKEGDIMWELMTNGPVQALMKVYRDFFLYGSGVYSRSSFVDQEDKFSLHSVKIVGWGEEQSLFGNPLKYWLAANSWGSSWGENGYFKIQRGTNESDIEQFILTVRSHLSEETGMINRRRSRAFRRHNRLSKNWV